MVKLKDIIQQTNILLDENFTNSEVIGWLNLGLNDLAATVGANFPELTISDMENSPVIPAKYHRLLVLYAAAKGKEKDSAIAEAQNFLAQYEAGKAQFASTYTVPDQYKDPDAPGSAVDPSELNGGYSNGNFPPNPYPTLWSW